MGMTKSDMDNLVNHCQAVKQHRGDTGDALLGHG